MAVRKPFRLLIPRKTQRPVQQPDYGTDMRAIEMWAQALVAYVDSITGGGGISSLTSTGGTIDITNPSGPTTNIDVKGPFLNEAAYSDANSNVGYGTGVLSLHTPSGSGNTAVGVDALQEAGGAALSGSQNTAVGNGAGADITTGSFNVCIGAGAGSVITTGRFNVAIGWNALAGTGGTSTGQICIGDQTSTSGNSAIAIGALTSAGAAGAVAIGTDSFLNAATTTTTNEFVLGTSNHTIVFSNHTTGIGSALLGSNCPASTLSQPAGWIVVRLAPGGTVGYIPVWE